MPLADPDSNVAGLALEKYKKAAATKVNKFTDLSFSLKACLAEFICMVRLPGVYHCPGCLLTHIAACRHHTHTHTHTHNAIDAVCVHWYSHGHG